MERKQSNDRKGRKRDRVDSNTSPPKCRRQELSEGHFQDGSAMKDPAILAIGDDISSIPLPSSPPGKLNVGVAAFLGSKMKHVPKAKDFDSKNYDKGSNSKGERSDKQKSDRFEGKRGNVFIPYRKWEDIGSKKYSSNKYFPFTIATYNVLAQNLLEDHRELYAYNDPAFLTWDYRSRNLLKELTYYQPDILCLQEVQNSQFTELFLPELQKLGYEGIYKCRTRNFQDGCATFFKKSKFHLDAVKHIEYFQKDVGILNRDNVGIVVLLRPVVPNVKGEDVNKLVVGNTHLLFNPKRGDVKLAQLQIILAEMDQLAICKQSKRPHFPSILCGDLNSEPHSPIYNLLHNGCLEYEGKHACTLSGQQEHRRKSNWPLQKELLPASLGITDNCQFYVDVIGQFQDYLKNQDIKKQASSIKSEDSLSEIDESREISVKPDSHTAVIEESTLATKPTNNHSLVSADDNDTSSSLQWSTNGGAMVDSLNHSVESGKPKSDDLLQESDQSPHHVFSSQSDSEKDSAQSKTDQIAEKYERTIKFSSGCLKHHLDFKSVYKHARTNENGPIPQSRWESSTYHGSANCAVDHIFYSKPRWSKKRLVNMQLHLTSRLQLPTGAEMEYMGCLPNKHVSSDHVILLAKMCMKIK